MEPVRGCTQGHCLYPVVNPEFAKPQMEILDTDSLGMREAKRLWNCSWHECHPNYMSGIEQYRILRDYEVEVKQLREEWEKTAKDRCSFFREYGDSIKRLEKMGKEMIEDLLTPPKKDFVAKFVEDNPNQAMAINAVCIASLAVFFLQRIVRR